MTREELRKQAEQMGYVLAKKKRMKRKGNTISRQAALNACMQSINILEAVDRIMDLPSVEQESKTGHWMIVHRKGIYTHLVCDKCLSNAPYDCRTNYCPNCGVKMVEQQERSEKE